MLCCCNLQVLQRQMPRLGDSMVVGSLWAFAVAGVLPSGLFQEGLLKLASLPADKARPLLLLQLFQAITLLQVRGLVVGPLHASGSVLLFIQSCRCG
jgi:hypothetical protein